MNLEEARAAIDAVDTNIVELLAKRAQLVTEIGRLKGRPEIVRDPAREEQVLDKVRALAHQHQLDPEFVAALYRRVMDYFVERQIRQLGGHSPE